LEYLVVDSDRQRRELYREGADGLWMLHPADCADSVHLTSVALELPADVLFVDLEEDVPAPAIDPESSP